MSDWQMIVSVVFNASEIAKAQLLGGRVPLLPIFGFASPIL